MLKFKSIWKRSKKIDKKDVDYHSQRSSAVGHCCLHPACNKPVDQFVAYYRKKNKKKLKDFLIYIGKLHMHQLDPKPTTSSSNSFIM